MPMASNELEQTEEKAVSQKPVWRSPQLKSLLVSLTQAGGYAGTDSANGLTQIS